MTRIRTYIKRFPHLIATALARRIDPFSPLQRVLPAVFFKDINYLPYLKKASLFLLIAVVIISFIITSMPHIFLT